MIYIKNNIFIKSTLTLIIGGLITRVLGFIIRVYYTRIIGEQGINLLSITMPTYSFLITIATLAMPLTISKLVSQNTTRSITIIKHATIIMMLINVFIITIVCISSNFIATTLLNEPNVKYIIISMALPLPFISVSSIIKGYFLGKQNTMPYMLSNVLEQILRLILILIGIPYLVAISPLHAVVGIMLLSIITETFSILVFLIFIPKNAKIRKEDLLLNKEINNDILSLSIPTVSSRIIGNIGYFLEPIILTNILIYIGYSSNYVISQYAVFSSYVIPILTMPSFLVQALSGTIIPEISKHHAANNKLMIKKRIKQVLIPTFIIGIIFSILISVFAPSILKILYDTNKGITYILVLAPVFSIFYLEGILFSILQGINKVKTAFKISLIGIIIKLILLIVLSFMHIGIYSLIIAEIINIFYIVIACLKELYKEKILF